MQSPRIERFLTRRHVVHIWFHRSEDGGWRHAGRTKVTLKSVPQNFYSYLELVDRAFLKTNSGMKEGGNSCQRCPDDTASTYTSPTDPDAQWNRSILGKFQRWRMKAKWSLQCRSSDIYKYIEWINTFSPQRSQYRQVLKMSKEACRRFWQQWASPTWWVTQPSYSEGGHWRYPVFCHVL